MPALAQQIRFDLAKQPAVSGIPEFARQAGIQIVAPVSQLRDQKTQAVRGTYSKEAGLARLLRGTGLRVVLRAGDIFSLALDPRKGAPAVLPKVEPDVAVKALPPKPTVAAEPPPEIIVTGTNDRISPSPQAEKKAAIAFVSSVGSAEISRRTDVSVAAAAMRLPGVAIARGTHTAQSWYPAIRGFNGRYSSVTLDGGMLFLSTRNQRGVPLDFLPAAAINQIVINKTVTPGMDPNSISGHVDVRTLRSFDDDAQPLTMLDVQAIDYHRADRRPSYAVNGVIKRTFGPGGDFGIVFAGSMHRDRFSESVNNTTTFVTQDGVDVPSGNLWTGDYGNEQRGASFMGKLEGRGDDWYGYVAANYFQEKIRRDLSRSNLFIIPALVRNARDGTGDFTGATPSALSNVYYNDRHIFSLRGGGEYQTDDRSKIVFNISFLHVDYKEQLWTGAPLDGPLVSGAYDIDDTRAASRIMGPAALSDPGRWLQRPGAAANQTIYPLIDKIYTTRIEYKSNNFDFSHGIGYDVGIDLRWLRRVLDQYANDYMLRPGGSIDLGQVLTPGSRFDGADPNRPVYVDQRRYWNLVSALGTRTITPALTANYAITEDVIAPFAAVYFTTDRFRLIAGARYNITRFSNATHTVVDGAIVPFRIKRSIPFLLPNIQGYVNIGDGFRLRAAFTETMALQDFVNFASGGATNFDYKGNPVVTTSNPYLKPRRSYNEDVSLEYYRPNGYVALGYFHKTIVDEVQQLTRYVYDRNGVLLQALLTPVNGGGEHSQGIEFEAQWRDFSGIAPWLRGVTLDVNGVWFDSDTEALLGEDIRRRVKGLAYQPKWMANVILSYERGRFSGAILGSVSGKAFNLITTSPAADLWIAPYGTIDAKLGYRLTPGFKIYLEGKNLTNSWYREVTGLRQDKVSTAVRGGPRFAAGANLAF